MKAWRTIRGGRTRVCRQLRTPCIRSAQREAQPCHLPCRHSQPGYMSPLFIDSQKSVAFTSIVRHLPAAGHWGHMARRRWSPSIAARALQRD